MTTKTGIGEPVLRKEDARLLVGAGRFSDDVDLPRQARAFVVRSAHAHARIRGIDCTRAKALKGVLAVLTADDFKADGLKPIPPDASTTMPIEVQRKLPDVVLVHRNGPITPTPYYPLAVDKVRYVGEAVVLVIAETLAIAKDAAELVEIDYDTLPPAIDTAQSAEEGAPLVWDNTSSNIFLDAEVGDAAATERAFANAAHVVKLETWVRRVTGVPMEARAAVGSYDKQTGRYFLHAGSGGVVRQKGEIATMLGVKPEQVRVVTYEIGGNFGTKNSIFPEFPLVLWASKRIGRPVKWVCERSEAFLSDYQGRDLVAKVELALDKKGRFLAMRGSHLSNVGAYTASIVPLRKGVSIFSGVYKVPLAYYRAYGVHSNTMPTAPYRSAGRPEAMFIMERLCDLAAIETGVDRIEIRRRNLIAPDELPYRTPFGVTYDNGNYEESMDRSIALADWHGFRKRRAESKRNGKLRGIGLANYIELTMGYPREWSEVKVLPSGIVEVAVGTLSSGQGHETSFAQCVSEWLGVPFESVRLVQGDTDIIPVGGGSHSGRSMRMAGVCMGNAANGVIERSRQIAAHMFKLEPKDIEFSNGSFTAGGYPYGCATCEVEIDPDTGAIEVVSYCATDDVGRAINPMILHGQTHGGAAQGVGQALWEQCVDDARSGQVMTGSFMDYAMPRSDNLPFFKTDLMEVPSPSNPLGVRAGGAGGTTPALAAVINAVVDALSEFGVTHLDMPATPECIWRAIRDGSRIPPRRCAERRARTGLSRVRHAVVTAEFRARGLSARASSIRGSREF